MEFDEEGENEEDGESAQGEGEDVSDFPDPTWINDLSESVRQHFASESHESERDDKSESVNQTKEADILKNLFLMNTNSDFNEHLNALKDLIHCQICYGNLNVDHNLMCNN